VFVNPDLTVNLARLPAGEWIAMSSHSVAVATGIGLSTSVLYDEQQRIGTASQSLYVERRHHAGG
jgi:hypothetical protein